MLVLLRLVFGIVWVPEGDGVWVFWLLFGGLFCVASGDLLIVLEL